MMGWGKDLLQVRGGVRICYRWGGKDLLQVTGVG